VTGYPAHLTANDECPRCSVAECGFCGQVAAIHDDALTQYGEPVCTTCFSRSFAADA
jgi:formylmethanofuran dehydrogenase subunit E